MEHIYDAPFCSVFRCDGDVHFHDYYYISPQTMDEHALMYQVHRAGIEHRLPSVFEVARDADASFTHIFCILSGTGYLEYGNKIHVLRPNQLVLLPAHIAHRYWCDPGDPMGKVWMEICGGDSGRIAWHVLQQHGPVIDTDQFSDICAQICMLQQRLMMDPCYEASLEVFQILHTIVFGDKGALPAVREQDRVNFVMAETFINAHLSRKITNRELAEVCGLSLQHFNKLFKENYGLTPQEYIMQQRLTKAQYALLHTDHSIVTISETFGFCDTSHFIRRFSEKYGVSPSKYKKLYASGE